MIEQLCNGVGGLIVCLNLHLLPLYNMGESFQD